MFRMEQFVMKLKNRYLKIVLSRLICLQSTTSFSFNPAFASSLLSLTYCTFENGPTAFSAPNSGWHKDN